jgi:biotin carboxylase
MSKGKVLLVGTSYGAMHMLLRLKKMGYSVSVCGGIESDPCHQHADESYYVDYSVKESLLELCKENIFDYIVPTCNDYSYNSASYVSTKMDKYFGFDNYSVTNILHEKELFRQFTLENNLPAPRSISKDNPAVNKFSDLPFPILVKPNDSFSGKGVTQVFSKDKVKTAIDKAESFSTDGKVVLEEFVDGTLHSHSAIIQNGEILIDFFVDEFCTVYPYQVNCSSLSYKLSSEIKIRVSASILKIIKKLSLKDGLLHTQFIAKDNVFWLIETMRRCPGDLYSELISKSTGFDYLDCYLKPFLNKKNPKKFNKNIKYIARHTVSVAKKMILGSVDYAVSTESLNIVPLVECGRTIKPAPFDKLSIIFLEFNSKEELMHGTPKIDKLVSVHEIKI